MTTNALFAVFADFNDPRDAPVAAPTEDAAAPIDEIGEIRSAAWTEGYLTARQCHGMQDGDQPLTAKLLTSVHALGSAAAEAVDAASLVVADLLVNTLIAALSDGWSARLLDRVRLVAERIKPALTVAPDFVLRDAHGTEQHFGDISALAKAMGVDGAGEDVTIRWHRGEATLSRMALLEDLREAIIPLSAGLADEQNIRSLK